MSTQLRENLRWAFGYARWYAFLFSGWALIASLARGSFQWPEYHMTTWEIVLAYWIAALLGTLLVGSLRPLTKYRLGAFLVGWLTGTVVYGSVAVTGSYTRTMPMWLMAIPGLLVGGGLALVWYDTG